MSLFQQYNSERGFQLGSAAILQQSCSNPAQLAAFFIRVPIRLFATGYNYYLHSHIPWQMKCITPLKKLLIHVANFLSYRTTFLPVSKYMQLMYTHSVYTLNILNSIPAPS